MKSKLFLLLLAVFILASPVFAQEGAAAVAPRPAINITSGLAMAIASGLCALAQGRALASSAEAIARNPGAGNVIRGALILGLAFIESLALFTLVIIFAGA
jgi:F-type H+-transporting ATPase subunit c